MNKQVESRYPLWTGLTSFENSIEHQVTSQNINLRRKKKKNFEIGLATVVFKKSFGICTNLAIQSGRVHAKFQYPSSKTVAMYRELPTNS